MEFIKTTWTTLSDYVKDNLVPILIIFGSLFIFVGSVFAGVLDALQFVPSGTEKSLSGIGTAILGAGVFAAIMKSSQFSTVFQKHIYDVIYSAEDVIKNDDLERKWTMLTKTIMRRYLPKSFENAANEILKHYFGSDIHYQFDRCSIKYDIEIDSSGMASIRHTTDTDLVISPHQDNPILTQQVRVGGDCKLTSLLVNNKQVSIEKLLTEDAENSNSKHFSLPLKSYVKKNGTEDMVVFSRTYRLTQNINKEPYINGTFQRFIKGCTIKAKVSKGYKLFFQKTGVNNSLDVTPFEDTDGFTNWVIAERDELILPGQGYTIIVTYDHP